MTALAIVNGRVWPHTGRATAVGVSGEHISHVGTDTDALDAAGKGALIIDAGGATIAPAFNDAHVHFLMASRSLSELDLFGAGTQAEVEQRIAGYARRHGGPWIVGRGWFYQAFPNAMPTVELLDRLVPDRPAYLESYDAHTGWANSLALAMAGIPGAGVLKEAETLRVTRHIPARTPAEDIDALRAGMRLAASRGIASVQEAGDGFDQLPLWRSLLDAGELTLRVRLGFDMTPGLATTEWHRRLDSYEAARRDRDAWLSTGILKAFADGVVESRTAAMLEPYADSTELGSPLWGRDELREAVRAADARGWQVQVHAIGDAAIRQALDAFEGTTAGRRHRVEHIESPAPSDVPRFARLGVVASMQPQHADPGLIETWRHNLGPARSARGWPWRTLLRSGARLAFGTDWPVVPLDPMRSLGVATTAPGERLELDEAVGAWTSGSAYAEHREHEKGRLRAGMLADVAVVDLDRGLVRATVVGGRVVFEEEAGAEAPAS